MTPPEFTVAMCRVARDAFFGNRGPDMDWDSRADMTIAQRLELISAVKSWLDEQVEEIEAEVEAKAQAEARQR